ncbi:ubiquitin carboxyl-terminal hydrolase 23 isoform X1 [Oryza sativa Japonica Group]|uniref:ubiquitin carboxyl-terminal hydrolase 23 isoform X1 n=1 Tax=Oryza sativa subsp. japonica TaxID=39947 RepID=UPI00077557A2|nr:ubiquitin carboxyl-terminal hydrolase 23 isoform X2 [Oryza sativa Japonica Group]
MMGEAEEGLMHRRIEFHAARRPPRAVEGAGGRFWVEILSPDADKAAVVAAARSEGLVRGLEKGEGSGGGIDPELRVARMYLRRIGAGLQNFGNTCYLNSVLQCLTYTEPFVAYLQSGEHMSSCRTIGFCALCALQRHVNSALQSTGKILRPVHIVRNLRCISRSFRISRQEDAHELMVSLLESMHKCCLPSGVPSGSPSAYEKSLVHRIFGGLLRSQVRCTTCSHCSNKFDPFLDLSLEIANAATLVKALQHFTAEELLDGGEKQYNCEHCRQKVVAKKRFMIEKAPSVLTIHLKRFSPFNPRHKIDKKVQFQPTLNLKPYVSNPEVYQVREADVLRQKAYMLFYVRDRTRSSVMYSDNCTVNLSVNKMISEKITCMNGSIKKDTVETKTLRVPSLVKEDVNLKKQNSENGQSSNISNAPQDQCSKSHSNTEVLEAAASPNNDPASTQKASCIRPDTAAVNLPMKTEQTAPDNRREITSPAQADVSVLHNASFNQKLYEKQLQEHQLETDDALTDSRKDAPAALCTYGVGDGLLGRNGQSSEPHIGPCPAALPIHNGGEGLLGANGQASEAHSGPCSSAFPIHNGGEGLLGASGQSSEPHTGPCPAALPIHDGGQGLLGPNGQASEPHTDSCPAAFPIHSGGEGLLGANGQASELHTDPCPAAFPIHSGGEGLLGANGQASEPHTDPCPAAFPIHSAGEGLLGANGQDSEHRTGPIPAAFPVWNGTGVILEKYGQVSGPADPFCKPTPTISDTVSIAQIIPTEHAAVSNGTVSSSDDLTGNTEANESSEFVKNYGEQVMVRDLSAETSGDRANADEQTSMQNNTLEVGKDVAKDTDNVANAEEQVLNHPLAEQVKSEKQIYPGISTTLICSEDTTQLIDKDTGSGKLNKKMNCKSKRQVKYPAVRMFFGPKQLLLASVKLHKKRKHKRSKKHHALSVHIESIITDQQTSTSETVFSKIISHKSRGQKRSCASASSEDGTQLFNKKQHIEGTTNSVPMDNNDTKLASADSNDAKLASAELPSSCTNSLVNQTDSRNNVNANERGPWHFNLLTRGLREITVPRWDDTEIKNTKETEILHPRTRSIGYVLDEWDEEYDRGKRKKIRKPKHGFSGPNPFQETANIRSRQRMRLQSDQTKSGNQPLRI